jgi:hypothetical protein
MCEAGVRIDLDVDATALDDVALADRIVALETLIRRAQAAQAAAVRTFDARDAADGFGCPSAKAWLCRDLGLSEREARTLVGLGRAADRLPALAAAFASGATTAAHLRIASAATRVLSPSTVAAGDAFLAATARRQDAARFARVVRTWVARVAPAEFERDTEKRYDSRWLSISETFGGMRSIQGMLDPESGALVEEALAALVAANAADDTRTRDQQRADALTELVRTATVCASSPASGAARPEILVHVPTLLADPTAPPATYDGGRPLAPAAFERLACDAQLRRLVLDPDGTPVELGRATRVVPPPLRKLVALRDGGCRYPGCVRRPAFCEAHHVVFWRHGGTTDASNLVLLCRYHHHLVHERGHELKLLPDGTVKVTRPDGRVVTGQPRGPDERDPLRRAGLQDVRGRGG